MPDFPTFKLTDAYDDELTIERSDDDGDTVAEIHAESVFVRRQEAPAVALAILEAAQAHMLDGAVAQAIVCLRSHLAYKAAEKRRQEEEAAKLREATEAKRREEEKLDAEALVLLNAFRRSAMGMSPLQALDGVPQIADAWREVAKAARTSLGAA